MQVKARNLLIQSKQKCGRNLPIPDPEGELQYVMNAVRTIRRELKGEVPLIGFSGSPLDTGNVYG